MAGKILRRSLLACGVIVILFIAAAVTLTYTERGRLREYLVTALGERFHSDVQIRDLQVYVYPRVYVAAHGISLRFHGRTDVPPLMTIETLTLSANLQVVAGGDEACGGRAHRRAGDYRASSTAEQAGGSETAEAENEIAGGD